MVMSGWSVNLIHTSQAVKKYCVPILSPVTDNSLLESVEGGNDFEKDFMFNFHKSMWPDLVSLRLAKTCNVNTSVSSIKNVVLALFQRCKPTVSVEM